MTMSEQNNGVANTNGTRRDTDDLPRKLFATREEAQSALDGLTTPPKGAKPFEISKGEKVLGWILAIGYDPAVSRAAQLDGYSASTGPRRAAVVTKDVIAGRLAQFTDEELEALGLSRKPAPKTSRR